MCVSVCTPWLGLLCTKGYTTQPNLQRLNNPTIELWSEQTQTILLLTIFTYHLYPGDARNSQPANLNIHVEGTRFHSLCIPHVA